MKKFLLIVLALCLAASSAACAVKPSPVQTPGTHINIGVLSGPTGVGAARLMQLGEEEKSKNDYTFSVAAAPTDLAGRLASGELDMAALPTNMAAALWKKTNGNIRIVALNTLGVLYILQNGKQISSMPELRGRTLYATGQGANPEYILNYILRKNGLEPGTDVTIIYKDSAELAALMASGSVELCMLPVPAATAVMLKNPDVTEAADLTEEWNKVSGGSTLAMGCVVVRKNAELPDGAVLAFLEEYGESVKYAKEHIPETAQLVAKYGITGSAEAAEAAIPYCGLVCITGEDIRPAAEGYYRVLFEADPTSTGGAMPDETFYWQAG